MNFTQFPSPWRRDICSIGKDWLKSRLQECVLAANDEVVALVSDNDEVATFIAEAAAVSHETGLMPRQLADQRKELIGVLREWLLANKHVRECDLEEQFDADQREEKARFAAEQLIPKLLRSGK